MLILSTVDAALTLQYTLVQIPLNGYNVVNVADVLQQMVNIAAASVIIQRSIVSIL
jgi:hypothetical protein